VYAFVSTFATEAGLHLRDILKETYIESLDKLRKVIDDQIARSFHEKIEKAKHHYYEDLTDQERQEKAGTEDYTLGSQSKKLKCPACQQEAMLSLKEIRRSEPHPRFTVIRRRLELEKLTCHYCGLLVDKPDELRTLFADEEVSLRSNVHIDPDDCPDADCPDDCEDCPEADCRDDCQEDCPD
jgi:transposase-like protein